MADMTTGMATDKPVKSATKSGIQVISRAARVLRSLEEHPHGLSLGEIASRVNLPRSTVQRIVTALAEEQLLIAATPKSRVKLGPALIRLARATNNEIDQVAHPFMAALCRGINETIDLSVMQGNTSVFIDQLLGTHRLRTVSAIGEQFPLHCTACGKALLSTLPDKKLGRALSRKLEVYTEHTITDPDVLRAEIAAIRKEGVAYDIEEHTEGVCAISVAFTDPLDRSFSISIPLPIHRFHRHKDRFTEELINCRDQIVATLGDSA